MTTEGICTSALFVYMDNTNLKFKYASNFRKKLAIGIRIPTLLSFNYSFGLAEIKRVSVQ